MRSQTQAEGALNLADEAVYRALQEDRNRIIGKINDLEQQFIDKQITFSEFVYKLAEFIEEGD